MLQDLYALARAPMTQGELNRVLGEHERYLVRQGGARAILRSAKLDGLVLANRNLSDADLSGASLIGANLYGTNCSRASLYCADLREADLRNARLDKADLRGVSFRGANLSFASLDYADLRAASMMYIGDKVEMRGNGDQKNLGAVDFTNCSLRNASFGNAKLDNANFTDALLQGACFRGAKLDKACFSGAILTGVNLSELKVPPEALKDSLIEPSEAAVARAETVRALVQAHHEWVCSGGKMGAPALIDGEDLRPLAGAFKGLFLAGISARHVQAAGVDFTGCQLQAAKFDFADLRMANFTSCDLSGVSFDGAKLSHANFQNARINDLILVNGDVLKARAERAQGVIDQFGNARINAPGFLPGLNAKSA